MRAGPSVDDSDVDATGVQLYETGPARRPFAAGDVVRLLVGVVLVAGGALLANLAQSTIEGIEADLVDALARFPDGVEEFVLHAGQLITSVVPFVVLVVLLVKRRWQVAVLLLLTGFVATLAMHLVGSLMMDRDLAALLDRLGADGSMTSSAYPDSRVLASTTAIVTVAAPWLSRGWKRALWGSVAGLVVLRMVAVAEPAFDLVVAVGVGTVVGSLVLVLFGSPNNEPRPLELLAGLREAGFDPRRIDRLEEDGASNQYELHEPDGTRYRVSLRTPDERDADLLDRLYRNFRFHESEVGASYHTVKRRIEHEALVLGLAARAGVRAPDPVRIGTTDRGSAFLVTSEPPTEPVAAEQLGEARFLRSTWAQVHQLHRGGLAHRRLALEALRIDEEGRPRLSGFDEAQTAPSERERARDLAVLLTETAVVIGPVAAVEAAVSAIGPDALAPSLGMLQPLALPGPTRARAADHPALLEHLRAEVMEATGADDIKLEDLERIKPRTLLIVGASTLAFYSLLPQLANLEATVDTFGEARLQWILAALAASALSYLFAAVSVQGAVAVPIPFGANVRARVASSFAGLVGPAGAGGLALTARFLQRVGVPPAEAAASVAVNAVGGFAVHLSLLAGFVVWSGQSGVGGFSVPDSSTVLLVLTLVLAAVGVLTAIRPVRRRVVAPLWASVVLGLHQIGRVFRSPARVAALFGGSAGVSLAYVGALACSIEAFGGDVSIAQIGAAYLVSVALAALAPTPGGLGALESAMIAALTGFGLADGVAVSATLTFRLTTFWLPILPGWLVMTRMERDDEL